MFQGNKITWILIREAPIVGGAWLLTAAVMWLWYVVMRRKLKVL